MKYRYDVEEHIDSKYVKKTKVKSLATGLIGAEMKVFLKNIVTTKGKPPEMVKVFKTTISPNGKAKRVEHKTMHYGVSHAVRNLFDENFQYVVDYNCNYYYACRMGSDCCDNDYCRCGRIENPTIISTDGFKSYVLNELIKISNLYKPVVDPDILAYCLERVIQYCADLTTDSFEISVRGGYYGEEVDSIKYQASRELIGFIIGVVEAPSSLDAVKMVLEMEYGFLLEESKDYEACEVHTVKRSSLVTPNEYRVKTLDKNYIKKYKEMDYDIPIGIYRKVNDKYEIIDGYHRFCAASKNKKNKVKLIVITKGA